MKRFLFPSIITAGLLIGGIANAGGIKSAMVEMIGKEVGCQIIADKFGATSLAEEHAAKLKEFLETGFVDEMHLYAGIGYGMAIGDLVNDAETAKRTYFGACVDGKAEHG